MYDEAVGGPSAEERPTNSASGLRTATGNTAHCHMDMKFVTPSPLVDSLLLRKLQQKRIPNYSQLQYCSHITCFEFRITLVLTVKNGFVLLPYVCLCHQMAQQKISGCCEILKFKLWLTAG